MVSCQENSRVTKRVYSVSWSQIGIAPVFGCLRNGRTTLSDIFFWVYRDVRSAVYVFRVACLSQHQVVEVYP